MLTIEQFIGRLESDFGRDTLKDVRPDDGLYDDLGLDSFDAFRLILFVEALASADFPPDVVPPMYRVADAYDYYRALTIDNVTSRSS